MTTTTIDFDRVQEFATKVAGDQAVAANALLAYLGDRLGLWRALAATPRTTSADLAAQTGLAERYLREWLAAQAAAGYVEYDPATRTYTLPAEYAAVFADDDSPASLAGVFEFIAATWASSDRLAHAFATGEGIAWHEQDPRLTTAVERNFRPFYTGYLLQEWLPALDGVEDRLRAGARVLDVGCGLGTATLLLAEAFPASVFTGVDADTESIRRARTAAASRGLADRVTFREAYAGASPDDRQDEEETEGEWDLVCFFDALHDLGDPVGALRQARASLAPGGTLLAVEPFAGDRVEENLNPVGLTWYVSSALVCVPNSLAQPGGAALGAQAGPERLLAAFRAAGFPQARIAATSPFNLVIEARA
ncbi:class I SAM-dependent methyltransferase [Cryptosporangium aurantiacum]|uniref:Methyltransferase domain-containing protein n=1 Tax=Cryptosporangium aurantiacum TaxID=134849 RepID=A0A1M7RBV2_9ACTN|nr:methyltransferase domain-containing protein [Cryptosporangium aurantiacum]SHN43612.1 Methyltransferase domain-containing protein [Cryptosporangium aurantiacum]